MYYSYYRLRQCFVFMCFTDTFNNLINKILLPGFMNILVSTAALENALKCSVGKKLRDWRKYLLCDGKLKKSVPCQRALMPQRRKSILNNTYLILFIILKNMCNATLFHCVSRRFLQKRMETYLRLCKCYILGIIFKQNNIDI